MQVNSKMYTKSEYNGKRTDEREIFQHTLIKS